MKHPSIGEFEELVLLGKRMLDSQYELRTGLYKLIPAISFGR
jgi:hypothetical protein